MDGSFPGRFGRNRYGPWRCPPRFLGRHVLDSSTLDYCICAESIFLPVSAQPTVRRLILSLCGAVILSRWLGNHWCQFDQTKASSQVLPGLSGVKPELHRAAFPVFGISFSSFKTQQAGWRLALSSGLMCLSLISSGTCTINFNGHEHAWQTPSSGSTLVRIFLWFLASSCFLISSEAGTVNQLVKSPTSFFGHATHTFDRDSDCSSGTNSPPSISHSKIV